jgi:hypothetical protein
MPAAAASSSSTSLSTSSVAPVRNVSLLPGCGKVMVEKLNAASIMTTEDICQWHAPTPPSGITVAQWQKLQHAAREHYSTRSSLDTWTQGSRAGGGGSGGLYWTYHHTWFQHVVHIPRQKRAILGHGRISILALRPSTGTWMCYVHHVGRRKKHSLYTWYPIWMLVALNRLWCGFDVTSDSEDEEPVTQAPYRVHLPTLAWLPPHHWYHSVDMDEVRMQRSTKVPQLPLYESAEDLQLSPVSLPVRWTRHWMEESKMWNQLHHVGVTQRT